MPCNGLPVGGAEGGSPGDAVAAQPASASQTSASATAPGRRPRPAHHPGRDRPRRSYSAAADEASGHRAQVAWIGRRVMSGSSFMRCSLGRGGGQTSRCGTTSRAHGARQFAHGGLRRRAGAHTCSSDKDVTDAGRSTRGAPEDPPGPAGDPAQGPPARRDPTREPAGHTGFASLSSGSSLRNRLGGRRRGRKAEATGTGERRRMTQPWVRWLAFAVLAATVLVSSCQALAAPAGTVAALQIVAGSAL